jgi:hypothetical protein
LGRTVVIATVEAAMRNYIRGLALILVLSAAIAAVTAAQDDSPAVGNCYEMAESSVPTICE